MLTSNSIRNEKRGKIQYKILELLIENNFYGSFQVSMGLGKGKIIADSILYVLNNKEYYNNIKDKKHPIIILVSSTFLRDTDTVRELINWGVPEDLIGSTIELVCYHTAYRWENKDIGFLICDEVDFALTPSYGKVFVNQTPTYCLTLTGTLIDEKVLLSKTFPYFPPVLYTYDVHKAQSDGIVNKNKIIVHYVPLSTDKNILVEYTKNNQKKSFYTSEVDQYQYIQKNIAKSYSKIKELKYELANAAGYNRGLVSKRLSKAYNELKYKQYGGGNKLSRTNVVYNLQSLTDYTIQLKKSLLQDTDSKVIIFCKFTDTIDKLTDNGYHSKISSEDGDKIIEDFNYGNIQEIGVSKKVNRGVNFTNLNHCIAHSYTSSETDYLQGIKGRMTRLPIDQTAYLHILVSYYIVKDVSGKNQIKTCQNYTWAEKFLEDDKSPKVSVSNIQEALNIINNDRIQ